MDTLLKEAKDKLDQALDFLKDDLATIHAGRVSTEMLQNIGVEAYEGSDKLKLSELGTFKTLGPLTLTFTPFDQSILEKINKAINAANLGVGAVIDGHLIRITMPALTEERRKEYVVLLKKKIEGGRVVVRQIRHEFKEMIDTVFSDGSLSEDEKFRLIKKLQEIVDEVNKKIEEAGEEKEKEIMRV